MVSLCPRVVAIFLGPEWMVVYVVLLMSEHVVAMITRALKRLASLFMISAETFQHNPNGFADLELAYVSK